MRFFRLPDLGEGLTEAEIVEWHVKAGDRIKADQIMLSVETAKAVVEIPSPQAGEIARCLGEVGEMVHVGEALVEFAGTDEEDTGTVVGDLGTRSAGVSVDKFTIGPRPGTPGTLVKAAPAVRALAKRLGIDLADVEPSGPQGAVTPEDLERSHRGRRLRSGYERLRSVRRTMARTMARAHAEVVPVTITEDADVDHWFRKDDTTIRLVEAVAAACRTAPALNAWFDGESIARRLHQGVDLGIAVNTEDGLFVPVLRNVADRSREDLRAGLDRLRQDVERRKIPLEEMQGATITLTNFGMFGGRYAGPVIVPPTVAIIGAGRVRRQPVAVNDAVVVHHIMPVTLTFDHRAATGAEAAQFMVAMVAALNA